MYNYKGCYLVSTRPLGIMSSKDISNPAKEPSVIRWENRDPQSVPRVILRCRLGVQIRCISLQSIMWLPFYPIISPHFPDSSPLTETFNVLHPPPVVAGKGFLLQVLYSPPPSAQTTPGYPAHSLMAWVLISHLLTLGNSGRLWLCNAFKPLALLLSGRDVPVSRNAKIRDQSCP